MEVDSIRVGAVDEAEEDLILLVKSASGEEEVGAAGRHLKGVILQQSLPHLSHLGAQRENGSQENASEPGFITVRTPKHDPSQEDASELGVMFTGPDCYKLIRSLESPLWAWALERGPQGPVGSCAQGMGDI